jgi:hypothetical protein
MRLLLNSDLAHVGFVAKKAILGEIFHLVLLLFHGSIFPPTIHILLLTHQRRFDN